MVMDVYYIHTHRIGMMAYYLGKSFYYDQENNDKTMKTLVYSFGKWEFCVNNLNINGFWWNIQQNVCVFVCICVWLAAVKGVKQRVGITRIMKNGIASFGGYIDG